MIKFKKFNIDQSKHLAGTLRAVAFAQFATFGYKSYVDESGSLITLFLSVLSFFWIELLSLNVLRNNYGN